MSICMILRCICFAKVIKIVITFEKVIKTFFVFFVTFVTKSCLLLLSLRKSNQNASAVLKKLKN